MSEKPTTKQPDNGHELLAAELSLGVLEGQALSDALARKETDRAFAAEVEAWSLRLAPLAEALTEHAPPARLKQRIEAHVFGEEARTSTSEPARLWTSLSFWRAATALFAATTVVAGVISLVGGPAPEPNERQPCLRRFKLTRPRRLYSFDLILRPASSHLQGRSQVRTAHRCSLSCG